MQFRRVDKSIENFLCQEQLEANLASNVEFKAGRWIHGTNALIGLYLRLGEITKHTKKMRPITINVVKPEITD